MEFRKDFEITIALPQQMVLTSWTVERSCSKETKGQNHFFKRLKLNDQYGNYVITKTQIVLPERHIVGEFSLSIGFQ